MALEMTKDTMTWKQRKGTHHSRILLEGDMIVPDNRPDVAQVLHCSGTVRLDEVKKAYGDIKALEDISLSLYQGELLCVAGLSGSGKSVLADIISGRMPKDGGRM